MYIEKINSPKDLKKVAVGELPAVCDEVRQAVLNRVSKHGGHVGPNLGFVEATVAMHYVFNTPEDRIVFDVSHQCYPHKILTGRASGFTSDADMNAISGYSSPLESAEYDNFEIGHTSTSIALATGLQKGRDILGGKENVIAVIGDGSLSGGEAFEGLNIASELGTNIIIIVNDNEMSIAENHGGMYRNLKLLRDTKGTAELNFFRTFGFDYKYLEEGNDVEKLVELFRGVKDIDHPIVLHIHTEKGHGYVPAVENKEAWHWNMPFDLETGASKVSFGESYNGILGQWLLEEMERDEKLVNISAAVPIILGFDEETRKKMGARHIDVGIAEEEAVALASGMAKRGAHPVFTTNATFLQRTYDQLSQDLAVNGNPAVINVAGASLFGMNDFTHICFFDIPLFSHIPNLVYLAPTNVEEMIAMEAWAIRQDKYSVALRIPFGEIAHAKGEVDTDYSAIDTYKIEHRGSQVVLIAVGNMMPRAERVAALLKEQGVDTTIVNPRFLSGTDEALLNSLLTDHCVVATLEDGSLDGGFGERIARHYGNTDMRVLNFGVKKALYDRYDVNELLSDNRLHEAQIVYDVLAALKK